MLYEVSVHADHFYIQAVIRLACTPPVNSQQLLDEFVCAATRLALGIPKTALSAVSRVLVEVRPQSSESQRPEATTSTQFVLSLTSQQIDQRRTETE